MTFLVIGLGNPGEKYATTRHNLGFMVLDAYVSQKSLTWTEKSKFHALIAEETRGNDKIIYCKPQTFYNLTGEAAQTLTSFYKLENSHILAIHDELDLPFGTLRSRLEGSSAGNNGIKSLNEHLGSDFARLRIGIGNELRIRQPAEVFVLQSFTTDEKVHLSDITGEAGRFIDRFTTKETPFEPTSVTVS